MIVKVTFLTRTHLNVKVSTTNNYTGTAKHKLKLEHKLGQTGKYVHSQQSSSSLDPPYVRDTCQALQKGTQPYMIWTQLPLIEPHAPLYTWTACNCVWSHPLLQAPLNPMLASRTSSMLPSSQNKLSLPQMMLIPTLRF